MTQLTTNGKHIDETNQLREIRLTLSNASEADQKVILIDSPAFTEESSQVVKGIAFGEENKISFSDTAQGKKLKALKAFSNIFPVHFKSVRIDADSMNQLSEPIVVKTPVLLDEPIVETIAPALRIGGADYELPAQLFIGEGTEVSFTLKAKTSVDVILQVGHYKAKRLVG